MKLLELTDFFGRGKEYIASDKIAGIQPFSRTTRRFLGPTIVKEGSRVYFVGSEHPTYVSETPEEIVQMIKGAF